MYEVVNDSISVRTSKTQCMSVPQMPYVDGNERNSSFNKHLADPTIEWQVETGDHRKLIVPVIVSGGTPMQLNKKHTVEFEATKTVKKPRRRCCLAASKCRQDLGRRFEALEADKGKGRRPSSRPRTSFPEIIAFHEELIAGAGQRNCADRRDSSLRVGTSVL